MTVSRKSGASRRVDLLCLAGFTIFWLAPVLYQGLLRRGAPWAPQTFQHIQNISCLFSHSVTEWHACYMQVLPDQGIGWLTLPEEDYFRARPFGHRTRLLSFMDFSSTADGYRGRSELAAWVRDRYRERTAGASVLAVRFVCARIPVSRDVPAGRWQSPRFETVPPERIMVLSTHFFAQP